MALRTTLRTALRTATSLGMGPILHQSTKHRSGIDGESFINRDAVGQRYHHVPRALSLPRGQRRQRHRRVFVEDERRRRRCLLINATAGHCQAKMNPLLGADAVTMHPVRLPTYPLSQG